MPETSSQRLHAYTLARMIRGCIVETRKHSATSWAEAEAKCDELNLWPARDRGSHWIVLDGHGQ